MTKPIKELIIIALELIGLGLSIGFIAYLSKPTYEVTHIANDNMAMRETLQEYRDLYLYDNRYVSGDDLLAIMQKKKGNYFYYIDIDETENSKYVCVNGLYTEEHSNLVDANGILLSPWDTDVLTNNLKINMVSDLGSTSKHKGTVVYYTQLVRIPEREFLAKSLGKSLTAYTKYDNKWDTIEFEDFIVEPALSFEVRNQYASIDNTDASGAVTGILCERYDAEYLEKIPDLKK